MKVETQISSEQYSEDVTKLENKRAELFKNIRRLYPKGSEKAQFKLCIELDESRVEYYINNIFKSDNK